MKSRRPDEFSDSHYIDQPSLTKTLLEYHLETLTNRKQEYLFENFCFELCQKEICPNLVPQSGPLGGGDSKRDSENYPVSNQITKHFFFTVSQEARKNKWAFAFSTQKKWKSKVQQDIEKISQVERKFDLIYFISNQNISDKKRSETEDELENTFGIEVRIFDRNWIVSKVFENRREELAIKNLNIEIAHSKKKIVGEKDYIKEKELSELKIKISDPDNYKNRNFVLVEDFIQAAKLSRSLELPRHETDGFLDQAIRISKEASINNQIIRALYNKAWTVYYWYDDAKTAFEVYKELESYTIHSPISYELEFLGNILITLNSYSLSPNSNINNSDLSPYITRYLSTLKKLFNEKSQPNNSLKAKSLFYVFKLFSNYNNPDEIKSALRKINSILKHSDYLLNFDVLTLIQIFDELSAFFDDYPEYDELFETICKVSEKRIGEIEKGKLYLNRGLQKYKLKKYNEALVLLEKSRIGFIKEESFEDFLRCSLAISSIYKKLNLYWAARKEILVIINHISLEFATTGEHSKNLVTCYSELINIELMLSRIPIVLLVQKHLIVFREVIDLKFEDKALKKILFEQDLLLSLLILKSQIWQLKHLSSLVYVLDNLNLPMSSLALEYALGYYEEFEKHENNHATDDLFAHCLIQPAYDDLPDIPIYHFKENIEYVTTILGCRIVLKFKNTINSIEFSEDLLGSIEAYFATIDYRELLLTKSIIHLVIRESDFIEFPGEIRKDEKQDVFEISIPKNLSEYNESKYQNKYREMLLIIIAYLLSESTYSQKDLKDSLHEHAKSGGFSRALNISPSYIFNSNIYGNEKQYMLGDWNLDIPKDQYKLKREKEWYREINQELKQNILKKKKISESSTVQNSRTYRHSDIEIVDHIVNESFWNKAKWESMLYLVPENPTKEELPQLGFVFANQEGASSLFFDLINKVGHIDKDEIIKISFIESVNVSDDYVVIFACDIDKYLIAKNIKPKSSKLVLIKQRMRRFQSTNKPIFNMFKDACKKTKEYKITPVLLKDKQFVFGEGLSIKKSQITFIKASNVNEKSFEYGTLQLVKTGKL